MGSNEDYEECVVSMEREKERWINTPAPFRGEIVR